MKQFAVRHESFSAQLTKFDTLYIVNIALPASLDGVERSSGNRSNNAIFGSNSAIYWRAPTVACLLLNLIPDS